MMVVTGATGLLGGNLAIELLAKGHRVRATRRSSSRVDHLGAHDIEWVEGSLGDPASLRKAFEGADAVFHCAALVSIIKKPSPALVATNVEGTRNVLNAVREAGVPRLVYCSTVGAIGLSDDGNPCNEESRWNFRERKMADGYVITKRQSQDLVMEAAAAGLDVVIANPTYMIGPYDHKPSSGRLVVQLLKGKIPGWTPGLNNFVDVRSVARGMILALERGERGEKYILGGENLSYKAFFERVAKLGGVSPPRRGIPRWISHVFGWGGDIKEWFSEREPMLNSVTVRYGYCRDFHFTSDKAKQTLGYDPGSLDDAIRDAIDWFRAHGYA